MVMAFSAMRSKLPEFCALNFVTLGAWDRES